jgi:hypothetical protein
MKKNMLILLIFLFIPLAVLRAEEGMWLPSLLGELKIGDMQEKGFRLSADDIYHINRAAITDAVVSFGGFCTGELISAEGLLITNHHCGLGSIQRHSSLENNYLDEGFWAMSREDELPNPELYVRFLREVQDVTGFVLEGVEDGMSEQSRAEIISRNIRKLQDEATDGTQWNALTKSFFYGSEYCMFLYEEFNDVRLVGAPPKAVGDFGGDTDNWIWPRHTGDFSIFRIYADEDNNPATYDAENIPYKPRNFLPVSAGGVETGDFTMVCGFPGNTDQYLLSSELEMIIGKNLPAKIRIRTERMEVMKDQMDKSEEIRIKYAAKYKDVTNDWKKWQGVIKGIYKVEAIGKKKAYEQNFREWISQNPAGRREYENILDTLEFLIQKESDLILSYEYQREVLGSVEILQFAKGFMDLVEAFQNMEVGEYYLDHTIDEARELSSDFFKDYNLDIDREIFRRLFTIYMADLPETHYPVPLKEAMQKYSWDIGRYSTYLYDKTIFSSKEKIMSLLEDPDQAAIKKIETDPVFSLAMACEDLSGKIRHAYRSITDGKNIKYRLYVKGLREMEPGRDFYADANGSMRIAYGQVRDYRPGDAIRYGPVTTLDGIIEKSYLPMDDYQIPEKLKELYEQKDYGPYSVNGKVPVCFIATNHTSGGNSGSPVLNADGHLVGINFDRNWEGTMSDYVYDVNQCRNIAVDIRYVLFIIDRYAGAAHLIDEMRLIHNKPH